MQGTAMGMQISKVLEPLDEMRALIEEWPDDPSGKDVHTLRKVARRAETVADMLDLQREPHMSKAWKTVDALRKSAGKARDLDVFKELLESLGPLDADGSVDELLQLVHKMRRKATDALKGKIEKHRKRLTWELAKCLEHIQGNVESCDAAQIQRDYEQGLKKQADKLCCVSRVTEKNAHVFRIRVKKLRDMLELYDDANGAVLKTLTSIKDDIGTWHDWHELLALAEDTLDSRESRQCIKGLKQTTREKLKHALSSANKLNTSEKVTALSLRIHVQNP
jgi:CHAD domain-containing protein